MNFVQNTRRQWMTWALAATMIGPALTSLISLDEFKSVFGYILVKFGCEPAMAVDVLEHAYKSGLEAHGVSFHVGSQQMELAAWDKALAQARAIFDAMQGYGISLAMVNLGGGFPGRYRAEVKPLEQYAEAVTAALIRHFGNRMPEVIIEPGRSIVGRAGVAEVVEPRVPQSARHDLHQ